MSKTVNVEQDKRIVEVLDWNPELHPRDDEGKFTEAPGDGLPDLDFSDFGTEQDRENVSSTLNDWVAWPTDEQTTPMWDAAREQTNNSNLPDVGIGSFLGDPQPEVQESFEKHQEWLTEQLREEHGDNVTAYRMLHGQPADDLRNGRRLEPRTLGSWTTSEDAFEQVAEQVEPNAEDGLEGSVVVEKEIPVENVFAVHAANENLEASGEKELIAALPETEDLSEGRVREATKVI